MLAAARGYERPAGPRRGAEPVRPRSGRVERTSPALDHPAHAGAPGLPVRLRDRRWPAVAVRRAGEAPAAGGRHPGAPGLAARPGSAAPRPDHGACPLLPRRPVPVVRHPHAPRRVRLRYEPPVRHRPPQEQGAPRHRRVRVDHPAGREQQVPDRRHELRGRGDHPVREREWTERRTADGPGRGRPGRGRAPGRPPSRRAPARGRRPRRSGPAPAPGRERGWSGHCSLVPGGPRRRRAPRHGHVYGRRTDLRGERPGQRRLRAGRAAVRACRAPARVAGSRSTQHGAAPGSRFAVGRSAALHAAGDPPDQARPPATGAARRQQRHRSATTRPGGDRRLRRTHRARQGADPGPGGSARQHGSPGPRELGARVRP